jgi:hypothetical protein
MPETNGIEMATDIEKLLQEIRSLPAEDQNRVREALRDAEAAEPAGPMDEAAAEEEFKRRLVKAGLLREIKPPIRDLTPYLDREPFEIEGKPLSETIIEERR